MVSHEGGVSTAESCVQIAKRLSLSLSRGPRVRGRRQANPPTIIAT